MTELERAKRLLSDGGYTCVLCNEGDIRALSERGVKPLVRLVEGGESFDGYSAADKVVGKATAFLYILLGVRSLYASVISRPALELLESAHIKIEYGTLTDNIINRAGDGICPFEAAVLDISTPEDAYAAILEKMRSMGISLL